MLKASLLMAIAGALCALALGCGASSSLVEAEPSEIPIHIRGTVGQFAGYIGFSQRPVQGYGVVVGLGEDGSSEVPPGLREYLVEYLHKQNLGWYRHGTADLHPSRILRDPDTAVVAVSGEIPYGAPAGARFDVRIAALPQTQTRSLDGGRLMPTELRLSSPGRDLPAGALSVWSMAGGEVFVSPLVDPSKPGSRVRLREGRVIGGGRLTRSTPVRLVLGQPSYARCRLIERRINQRFRDASGPVATAKNDAIIEVRIPQAQRRTYESFLSLILRLPLDQGATASEMHTQEIIEALREPDALHGALSVVLEATGTEILSMIQPHYASEVETVSFFTARAGLRLGDTTAASVIISTARNTASPLRMQAISELGRHLDLATAVPTLRDLLDEEGELVRIAAYEALSRLGDRGRIRSIDVGPHFRADIVTSKGARVIYAAQSGEPRIVLFGADTPINRPAFFSLGDDLVTVWSVEGNDKLLVQRKIPRHGVFSDPLPTDFNVLALARTLAAPAERDASGQIRGLALTYSQVLRVLYGMCLQDAIPARFILQRPVGIRRIYQEADAVGRPEI
jgi:flagellar P-ring protein FlgI/HEAT repeat protein